MRFDVDKVMRRLVVKGTPFIAMTLEFMNIHRLAKEGLKVRSSEESPVLVWSLVFGQLYGPKKAVFGFTLHEACIRAVKFLKKAKPAEVVALGAIKPRKVNHYLRKKGMART